jgi:hypothetical protein
MLELISPHVEHAVHVESPIGEVSLFPIAELQLTLTARARDVDANSFESLDMVLTQAGSDDVKCPIPSLEAFPNEGQQDAILLFDVVEECADVSLFTQLRTGKTDGLRGVPMDVHESSFPCVCRLGIGGAAEAPMAELHETVPKNSLWCAGSPTY